MIAKVTWNEIVCYEAEFVVSGVDDGSLEKAVVFSSSGARTQRSFDREVVDVEIVSK